SDALLGTFCRHLGVTLEEVSADGAFMVEQSPCLGLCSHAPAVLAGEEALGPVPPEKAPGLFAGENFHPQTVIRGDLRLLTANCGGRRPASLEVYEAGGGYAGLRKALFMDPGAVIAEVKASGLVGRGGAAFPTGLKLEGASVAPGYPKYVICNADESEPGTFKDRVLLEGDPHRVLEGLIIAGSTINAEQGYIYVRGEYPQAYRVVRQAVEQARAAGYLGKNILSSGFDFDVEVRLGAGAYICGEETAMFESIEGKRGFPRIKPPFPTTHGLFGQPTVINNVETLANLPFILQHGAQEYRRFGTDRSPGTKLFCVSGDVTCPGLYEVPFGVTLRHLLFDLAGGVREGNRLGAVLFGGAAGAFATGKDLDVRLSFEDLRAAGLPLGSGVVMVFDEQRDLRDVLARLARFFAHESCGKCYPCQIGTRRQYEILDRLAAGGALPGDADRLSDIGWTMSDASICGLGQTAASAVLSAMQLWPELFNNSPRTG
ncbi:MAG TPA: NADH-ubiquinone oxidoreductase-F iron-sulfur binding region domain-containing protein, partial [Anaerolineales bacterium]|nr:NADH-ubiquinone oxidoreductase-F iron-sulfur binding region domain-containing protein [Anaerolineales bacterium]